MPTANTRIVNFNIADVSTLTCSNTASLSAVDWLKTNKKGDVLVTTGTSTVITATFPGSETVGLVAFPICNLTHNATMRVQAGAFDSGAIACVATPAKLYANWDTTPAGVAGFPFGGGRYAIVWVDQQVSASSVTITISDSGNPQGHLEFARLVIGEYHEVDYSPDEGSSSVAPVPMSTKSRSGAGDDLTNRAPQAKKIKIDLRNTSDAQRHYIIQTLFKNDLVYPVFVSLYPLHDDMLKEHEFSVYGKLSQASQVTIEQFGFDSATLEIEQI